MKLFKLGHLLLLTLVVTSFETGASMNGTESSKYAFEVVRQLEESRGMGLEPVRRVYETGEAALEPLRQRLSDRRAFRGTCGGLAYESVYILEDQEPAGESVTPSRDPTLGEVSLYLIVAILRGDLFFSPRCGLETEGDLSESEIDTALLAIQQLLAKPLEEASWTAEDLHREILELLESKGLAFLKSSNPC